MKEHFRVRTSPLADPANVVSGRRADTAYRFTVLDSGLLRLESSSTGEFEDRASAFALDRAFPPTDFIVRESEDCLEIHTSRLRLRYDKGPFTAGGLSVQSVGLGHGSGATWHFGDRPANLGGTARTLDEADGRVPLEDGVLARDGVALVDDSRTVLFTDDGWIAERPPGNQDLYVFAYHRDYKDALRAFFKLAGPQPLLPRFVFGNWWSRFHRYTAQEYLDLMDRFRDEEVPLSVAVVDMDWHLVDIDPRLGSGWTGYTWNRELFPDPPAFLAELHRRGFAVSLNVHPADGVRAHEAAYPRLARRVGIDPATEVPVHFDLTDPDLVDAYLEEVHHPLEADGVDFWWLDWQQGSVTRIADLDPLWLLNHVHYLDSGRDGRRPITFSRFAATGSHRYPIGFSGDTHITWEALQFQPYFTATAANVGYGWWSHDIGGHFFGYKDDELATRWVQLGAFSPILRLHAGNGPFNGKEPWRHGEQAARVMADFLRLRHQLVPYLYTMSVRAHTGPEPLVRPMYHEHPWEQAAYDVPNQFMFGSDLLVAPITTPTDPATGLGQVRAWLPPGDWVDVFTGLSYDGGRRLDLYRGLGSIPVLARAGTILPLVPVENVVAGTANPDALEIRLYAGADAEFVLIEDQDDEQWARTRFTYAAGDGTLTIHPVDGELASVPGRRTYHLVACGFAGLSAADVVVGEVDPQHVPLTSGPTAASVRLTVGVVEPTQRVTVRLRGDLALRPNEPTAAVFDLLDRAQTDFAQKAAVFDLVRSASSPERALRDLLALGLPAGLLGAVAEQLTAR